jgi:2-oxoisovalerate dehydrogenase E1 component
MKPSKASGNTASKNQKPYLVECMTFRMRGHEEASGTKYVPKELFEEWAIKDPVKNYEEWLIGQSVLSSAEVEQIRADLKTILNPN